MENIKEQFLNNIEHHSMRVILDEGVNRHISFTKNGSSIYRFDLITWFGHLCISSDCGTYVFSRLHDMFEFFNDDLESLAINPSYWGEKLQSICRQGGYQEFSLEKMKQCAREDFKDIKFESVEARQKEEADFEEMLGMLDDDQSRAYDQIMDYRTECDQELNPDFWEHSFHEPSYHYTWCLYAIVYGIGMYRKAQAHKHTDDANDHKQEHKITHSYKKTTTETVEALPEQLG